MKDKYSPAKREHYGRRLAAHLCEQHFTALTIPPTSTLDGPAVLRFTPIRQVNLFVVQQLLVQWTAEMARLRSPYFDFEAPEVRQALTQFMNSLSRRIRMTRTTFEPLLAQAISDTLGVVTDPVQTFDQKLLNSQPSATVEQLTDALRYLDIDKAFYQEFLGTLAPATPLQRDFLLNSFRTYQEEHYKNLQSLEKLVHEFSDLLPITVADLWEDGPVSPATVAVPAPIAAPAPAVVVPVVAPPVAAPAVTPAALPATAQRPLAAAAATAVPLYEKLKADRPAGTSLSETLRPERPAATLADRAPKFESLKEAISINQRFSFINELFNGENMEYHAVIQHLDTLPDAEEARQYVTDELATKYDWTRKEDHVGKLLKLIERKFA